MNDKQLRNTINEAIESEKAPDDLVFDTLQIMHAEMDSAKASAAQENRSILYMAKAWIRDASAGFFGNLSTYSCSDYRAQIRCRKRIPVGGFAAVAAAALICLGVSSARMPRISPAAFDYEEDVRLQMIIRADGDVQSSVPQIREEMEQRFSEITEGYHLIGFDFMDYAMSEKSPVIWAATAQYETEAGKAVRVSIANFQTSVYDVLNSNKPTVIHEKQVFTGKDNENGDLFAVWETSDQFVQIQLQGEENWSNAEFMNLLKLMVQKL